MPTTKSGEQVMEPLKERTVEEARGRISSLPIDHLVEAREALVKLREQVSDQSADEVLDTFEPIIRAIGWNEAFVYVIETIGGQAALQAFLKNYVGQQA